MLKKILLLLSLLAGGCVGIPDRVQPVKGFDLQRYLGTWYEIARLDHSFERNLSRVSAEYSLRPDGGVRVVNRGWLAPEARWKEAVGRAYFVQEADQGYLKVSFFGPFYGSYVIFSLDHAGYQHALVCGPDHSYLWILARSTSLSDGVKQQLIARARDAGFDVSSLIWVSHD